ncbi:hypothetical protein [Streptomyces sp. NPDC051219]
MSPIEARIRERHATVHALLAQGHGIREIARDDLDDYERGR